MEDVSEGEHEERVSVNNKQLQPKEPVLVNQNDTFMPNSQEAKRVVFEQNAIELVATPKNKEEVITKVNKAFEHNATDVRNDEIYNYIKANSDAIKALFFSDNSEFKQTKTH